MSTSTQFTFAVRVLLCVRCGAPLEAEMAGGTFQCRFCGTPNQLRARAAMAGFAPTSFAARVAEPERVQRLRMQDGQPLLPPASIAHLLTGSEIPPWKMQEVLAVWQSARERADQGAVDAAEELLFLTIVLSNMYSQEDRLRQRAMVESALEVFRLPRHRAWMLGLLCRGACRELDVAGAESWLAMLDPHSDDLATDSSYRLSRAMVATCKRQYAETLAVLGATRGEVPILDAMDGLAAVLRVDALEKLGRGDLAVPMLADELGRPGSGPNLEKSIANLSALSLCTQSLPAARAVRDAGAARAAGHAASGGVHVVFIPLGVLMLVGGLGMCVVALLAVLDVLESGLASLFVAGGILTAVGLVFTFLGAALRASAKKAERIRLHGVPATGRVLGAVPTGVRINDVPMIKFDIEVVVPGQPPFQTTMHSLLSSTLGRLSVGGQVRLRVDPQNPREVVLE